MKKTIATLAVGLAASVGLSAPAHADTVTLPYGGTATLTVPDVVLPASGGCVNHYGTFSTTHTDYWNADLSANGPSTWPASDYLYGTGAQTQPVSLLLCPSFDQPGLYTVSGPLTVEDPYSYEQRVVMISDQFTISRPVVTPPPPPPPPVVVPQPTPAPIKVDVTGKVSKQRVTRGVKFTFRSNDIPAGRTAGANLKWSVKYDNKTKTLRQGPGEVDSMTVKFPRGTHKVTVLRNGYRVLSTTVRAG